LIIGLDGATFDILNPMMDRGLMPHLRQFIDRGSAGILESTTPPITPAAWTTFMTGKGPGQHGIVDFERYDVKHNRLSFNSTETIREKTIWEILSEKNLRVGSINLPMTYPPSKVNGFMISGFETPSVKADFTYPQNLKADILERWPGYNYRSNWQRKTLGGMEIYQRNLDYINDSFVQGCEITKYCGDKYGWDVMMVLYKLVDNLQHKVWRHLDPKTSGSDPERAKRAADCFKHLDDVLGDLFAYAEEKGAAVLIMSDHGHGSLDGKAQPNLLLKKWGHLRLVSKTSQAKTRTTYMLNRMFRKDTSRFAANYGVEHDLAVDWPRTRACVVHAGMCGFLYLNLKGRQPEGIVEPGDYEKLRDEIRGRFLGEKAKTADGRTINVFPEVHKAEELYNCSRQEQEWMPDLLLVPYDGLAVVRKIRGHSHVRWTPPHRREGTHRRAGILAVQGPHIREGYTVHGQIADIAPTLLAMLGLRIPKDMEGRVLLDIFAKPPTIEFEPPQTRDFEESAEDVYSDEDRKAIADRLSDLGYLE
jgi:predicted AlkP superfamily phosphohydrolase/phosphomutase